MSSKYSIEDLRKKVPQIEVKTDHESLEFYGKDWTKNYDPKPSAIAFPKNTEEVSSLLRYCNENQIQIVPSGGRTGLSAGAVAKDGELVVSLEKMNFMGEVNPLSQTVHVGAGAITEQVHEHSKPYGLTWPVDFASKGSSQVGGNLSTNAGGVKVIRHGLTRNWVMGVKVVLMDGTILDLLEPLEKNCTGVDLKQVFIGSEGTLGIITEATLKLKKIHPKTEVFFFGVESLKQAIELLSHTRSTAPFEILAFEYLDSGCFDLVLEHQKSLKNPLQGKYGSYVLLEGEVESSEESSEKINSWLENLFESGKVLDGTMAQNSKEHSELWSLREMVAESIMTKSIVHKNDVSVSIPKLVSFTEKMLEAYQKNYPTWPVYVFGHLGDGNLHVNIAKPHDLEKEAFFRECHKTDIVLFETVKSFKGSISAEHGVGLTKKAWLSYSRSKEELEIFKRMKLIFDPKNLLNPHKIFEQDMKEFRA